MSLRPGSDARWPDELRKAFRLAAGDHVGNVLETVTAGETLRVSGPDGLNSGSLGSAGRPEKDRGVEEFASLKANQNIKRFHKVALVDLAVGDQVVRGGYVIGIASCPIRRGDWVHIHNLKSQRA